MRVGGGRRGKVKGSGGSRQVGCQVTSELEVNSYPLATTAGESKNYSQRFTQRIGRRVKPQSGGRFGQGAATAGDVRLRNFRERSDQQCEGSKSKINFLAKANINILRVVNKPNTIQNKNGHGKSRSGHSTSNKNKQIRSRVQSL